MGYLIPTGNSNAIQGLGYGAAIKSIFLKSKEIGTKVLVTLDADGQHDVNEHHYQD